MHDVFSVMWCQRERQKLGAAMSAACHKGAAAYHDRALTYPVMTMP